MLADPPTDEELRDTFEELLAGPPPDGSAVSDTGLDEQTMMALARVWAGPRSLALIQAARQELAMQLDGTHAQEATAEALAIFRET